MKDKELHQTVTSSFPFDPVYESDHACRVLSAQTVSMTMEPVTEAFVTCGLLLLNTLSALSVDSISILTVVISFRQM